MTNFDYIVNNMDCVKELIMRGMISTCVLSHFRIYSQFQNYIKMGHPVGRSATITSYKNNISEQTMFNIKKEMEAIR